MNSESLFDEALFAARRAIYDKVMEAIKNVANKSATLHSDPIGIMNYRWDGDAEDAEFVELEKE